MEFSSGANHPLKSLDRIIWTSQTIAALTLAAAFIAVKMPLVLPVVLAWMILFLIGWRIGWRWLADFLLVGGSALIGTACFLGAPILWMLVPLLAQLVAWDFYCLKKKLEEYSRIEKYEVMIGYHFRRLAAVMVASYLLVLVSRTLELKMDVWGIMLLGLILIFGLNLVFRSIRRQEN